MKRALTIVTIVLITVSFLAAGHSRAEAMNNESAALLTAGIVLMGIPVMHALAHGGAHTGNVYVHAAAPPRYGERTRVIYVQPEYERRHRHWRRAYVRGYRSEWRHLEYRKGRHDARRDFRRHR